MYYLYPNELCHHGINGQKWGVRRYQNADGSLTMLGKLRYRTPENFQAVQQAELRAKQSVEAAKNRKIVEREVKKLQKQYGLDSRGVPIDRAKAAAQRKTERATRKAKHDYEERMKRDAQKQLIEDKKKRKQAEDIQKHKTKKLSEMSNEEIQAHIDRLRLEKQLKDLQPQKRNRGKEFAEKALDTTMSAVMDVGKDTLKAMLKKELSAQLGVKYDSDKKDKDKKKDD